ncbi:hypothetical protein G7046_g8299 [Stylonectria norvegica]|nr:hypothetical protein G7046_g8299 [Stylonectria norvegica]
MPSLGFLKKKRTREGNTDPPASNLTSPITPTTSATASSTAPRRSVSKTFGSSFLPRSTSTTARNQQAQAQQQQQQQPSQQQPQSYPPQSHQLQNPHSQSYTQQPPQQPPPPPPPSQSQAGTQQQQQQYNSSSAPAQRSAATEAESQQMSSVNAYPSYTTAAPTAQSYDSQNLPSINNLINPPQHDGPIGNNYNNGQSHSPYQQESLADVPDQAERTFSPGTDPNLLHHQQQQVSPSPTMDPSPQFEQHQQFQSSPQQHHKQQPSTSSQARVTKGKYSLGDFDILRTLGTGSFGRVHLVQSKHNQRFYAVKVLKKAQVVKMKQVEHTNDERRMLSDVKHPFLITLWGTFQDCRNLYMVMDFVEGGELFSLLRKSGRFPNPVAKFYAAEVTLALEYLHSKNIIYRDLKPENLLLDRHGHLKITDFGFAKRVPDKTWTLCGTPDYLAPEVVSNKGYNKSVDWWSLGILIYEMLCGYTPFWDSGSPMKIYENILKGKVKYPAYVNPDAQNLLERLITADLTKRLGNLYGGPGDVKNHPWFTEVTWDRLSRKDIDAPYTPPVKAGAGDASQFDRYPEDPEKYGQGGSDEFGNLFTEF